MGMFTTTLETLVGFAPDIIDKVRDARVAFEKSGNLTRLVEEYKTIAMMNGCSVLCDLLGNRYKIDEIHQRCMDGFSRQEIHSILLADARVPEEQLERTQTTARLFIDDYFEAATRIDSDEAASSVALVKEAVRTGNNGINDRLSLVLANQSDSNAETNLLLEKTIEGRISLGEVRDRVEKNGRRGDLLLCWGLLIDLLSDKEPTEIAVEAAGRHAEFGRFLVEVAVSAWNLEAASSIAKSVDNLLWADLKHLTPYLNCEAGPESVARGGKLEGFSFVEFATLAIAEHAFHYNAFELAVSHFSLIDRRLNPIAQLHKTTSDVLLDIQNVHGRHDLTQLTSLADQLTDLYSIRILEQSAWVMGLAISLCSQELADNAFRRMGSHARGLCQEEYVTRNLSHFTAAEAWTYLNESDKHDKVIVLISVSEHLLGMPDEQEATISYWKRRQYKLEEHPAAFEFYISRIEPDLTAEQCEELAGSRINEPVYLLALATRFNRTAPNSASSYADRAVQLMLENKGENVDLLHLSYWVTHLIDAQRFDDIAAIVSFFPRFPRMPLWEIISHLDNSNAPVEVVDDILLQQHVEDETNAAYGLFILANHYFKRGDYEKALDLSHRSYCIDPNRAPATLGVSCCNYLAKKAPSEMLAFLEEQVDSRSLFLAAGQERLFGSASVADDLLIKGILLADDDSYRASMAYIGAHVHRPSGHPTCQAVREDTVTTCELENGETVVYAIHISDARLPKAPYTYGGAIHIPCRDPQFALLFGKGIGDRVRLIDGGVDGQIKSIELLVDWLLRDCFARAESYPGVTVIKDTPDSIKTLFDTVILQARSSSRISEMLRNGIELETGQRLLYGLSSGARLAGINELKYGLQVASDKKMPLYRSPGNSCWTEDANDIFLLSVSAVLILALSGFVPDGAGIPMGRFRVSSSTKAWLTREALDLVEEYRGSEGYLTAGSEGNPLLFTLTDEDVGRAEQLLADLSAFLESITELEDDSRLSHQERAVFTKLIGVREGGDYCLAAERGMVYVSEDFLESQLLFTSHNVSWCNLNQALSAVGANARQQSYLAAAMAEIGCIPAIDEGLFDTLKKALAYGVDSLGDDEAVAVAVIARILAGLRYDDLSTPVEAQQE